jgi:hypothetical protein
VRTIDKRFLFHWTTGFTDRFVALVVLSAWTATLAPASTKVVRNRSIDTPSR